MKRAEIIAKGKVQGVGFRNFVYEKAIYLRLNGFTLNLDNGDVRTVVEGEEENIDSLLNYIKKGNGISIVNEVLITWNSPTGEFHDFKIKR